MPSQRPTLGVEWEIGIIDPETKDLVALGPEVVSEIQGAACNAAAEDAAGAARNAAADAIAQRVKLEFLKNTVELVTGVCTNTSEAMAQLSETLGAVRQQVESHGGQLWASGSHPFSDFREQPLGDKPSYREIIERTKYWGSQMLIWGVHVHVGISNQDVVWPVINAVMTKYPHLLALTASSPAWEGMDTGYASNRTMLYQQLPTAGMPYQFQNWQQWQDFMLDQTRSGVISHTKSMHFDVRPASRLGTIEVRICDAPSNLRELAAVVAFTHCLVVYYARLAEAGESLPTLQPWHVAENKWRGARYGLDALVITSRDTQESWVRDDTADLLDELYPIAQELGCEKDLQLVVDILRRGAGCDRQRQYYREMGGSWQRVVEETAKEMITMRYPGA